MGQMPHHSMVLKDALANGFVNLVNIAAKPYIYTIYRVLCTGP